ncbi:hypothetical protein BGX26_010231 [Mortierella sp. AD094]|nr:hypothetical protein BGX26_010231 [Mortierella sp. AD094]
MGKFRNSSSLQFTNCSDTRINRTKQLLKWFIEQKSSWNPNHEFAIMILGAMAVWHMDFTSDTVLLSHAIDELYTMGKFKEFDSTTLFREILEHSNLDQDDGSTIRLIMIYTRSDVLPSIPDPEVLDVLAASGRFSYDCVYIHQKAGEVSGPVKPQHVYDRLTEMEDIRTPGYYYELTRILKKYSSAMGELLAHPSVRAVQDVMSYKMKPPPSVRRMEEIAQQQQQLHLEQPTRQQQQQQIYQHHIRQQQMSPSPTKGDMTVSYRGSDNSTGAEPWASLEVQHHRHRHPLDYQILDLSRCRHHTLHRPPHLRLQRNVNAPVHQEEKLNHHRLALYPAKDHL